MFFCADIAKTTPKVGFPGSPEAKDFVYLHRVGIEAPTYTTTSSPGITPPLSMASSATGRVLSFAFPMTAFQIISIKVVIVGKKVFASLLGQAGVFAKKVTTKISQQVPAAALIVCLATNTCEINIR